MLRCVAFLFIAIGTPEQQLKQEQSFLDAYVYS